MNQFATPAQLFLLRACLLEPDRALEAYRVWKEGTDFDQIDAGTFRLLPLLYRNLEALVQDDLTPRLKGVYRLNWTRRQHGLRRAQNVLEAFNRAGVRSLILKGMALSLRYYPDPVTRPMSDLDLLVPRDQLEEAWRILEGSGYRQHLVELDRYEHPQLAHLRPTRLTRQRLTRTIHSVAFRDAQDQELDLHWWLTDFPAPEDAEHQLWTHSEPLEVAGVTTLTLCASDHLVQTCVHGLAYNVVPPIRWMADAVMILRSNCVDWTRVIEQTRSRQVSFYVFNALEYINTQIDVFTPASVLNELRSMRPLPFARLEIELNTRARTQWKELCLLWCFWQRHRLLGDRRSLWHFLQDRLYLDHAHHLPIYALIRANQRIRNAQQRT